jgi:gluconate:H+ symporter, GntP family
VTAHSFALLPATVSSTGQTQLLVAAAVGIATVVLLITAAKFRPFRALILGTAPLGVVAVLLVSLVV